MEEKRAAQLAAELEKAKEEGTDLESSQAPKFEVKQTNSRKFWKK